MATRPATAMSVLGRLAPSDKGRPPAYHLNLGLFRDFQCVIDLDAEVAHGAL